MMLERDKLNERAKKARMHYENGTDWPIIKVWFKVIMLRYKAWRAARHGLNKITVYCTIRKRAANKKVEEILSHKYGYRIVWSGFLYSDEDLIMHIYF